MDHLTSVSDIPLPGEDINNRNELNHGILQGEANISAPLNPEFNKPIEENVTYTENIPDYSSTKIRFDDEHAMIIDQQIEAQPVISENISEGKTIPHEDTSIINTMQEIQTDRENMDTEVHILQETIIDDDQPQSTIKSDESEKLDEQERQQILAEAVEDLQKFVEQTTQEAVVTVNDNAIQTVEFVEETTESIAGQPEILTDTAVIVTEPCEITETAEVRTETIENPAEIIVSLEEIIDVPVHDNSVEIKEEDISANNISISSELESSADKSEQQIEQTQNEEIHEAVEVIEEIRTKPEIIETPVSVESNPVKRIVRSNSTIEAIKNEWTETDTLTIEEIKEETAVSVSSPKSVPIVTESEIETTQEEEIENIIIEEEEESMTEVIVLQSVNDAIALNLDQNVTIEIIDEIKIRDADKVEPEQQQQQQQQQHQQQHQQHHHQQQQQQQEKPEESKNEAPVKSNNSTKEAPPTIIPDKKSNAGKTDGKQGKQDEPTNKPIKRKPHKDDRNPPIPCHLLGRNVDNPTEDLLSNGRAPPKPRLGVKVPYRFLTSQIVSKQDITKELLEIHAKRNPERDPPVGGDIFFAKKLTQRLASKISQSEKAKKERSEQNNTMISGIPDDALLTPPNSQTSDLSSSTPTTKPSTQGSSKSINDNSDLLAILEGDVDVDLTKEIRNSKLKSSDSFDTDHQIEKALENIASTPQESPVARRFKKMDPEMEREIALKQLESLPKEHKPSVRKYGRRGRPCKYYRDPIDIKPIIKRESKIEVAKANIGEPSTPSKPPPKSTLEVVQSIEKEPSENVKQADENIVDKSKKKKLKDISPKVDKTNKSDDILSDDLDASLTPKKVSKTYSRKDNVVNVNVPADLEQIVNDQSALESEESVQEETIEKSKENDDKKSVKSPLSQQKRPRRSIGDDINNPGVTLVSKRARVIKPKVIWDPAESVPRKMKPIVVDPTKPKRGRPRKIPDAEKTIETTKKSDPETSNAENDAADKEEKEAKKTEEKEAKKTEEKMDTEEVEEEEDEEEEEREEKDTEYKPVRRIGRPMKILKKKGKILSRTALKVQGKKKILIKRQIRSLAGKLIRSTNGDLKSSLALSKKKKQLVQKLANEVKSANKPKKTELDKLLSDEGAVNMLYSVRQDDKVPGKRTPSKLIPSKDLLNRTIALRKVITQSSINEDTPTKALRKKENLALSPIKITQKERKKSRDSIRSSIQSPPPSPSYASNRAEASRIIRRHSSSFSSDCSSPRRLSIDLQNVQENAEKQEVKVTEQKEEEPKKEATDFSSPARSLRRKGGVPIYERKADEKTYKGKKKLLPETETTKDSDSTKDEKESADRLTPTTDKSDKTDKPEKLSAAEKRKLSNEMSKNFSKSPVPKKRTRNSKTEEDEEPTKEEAGKAGQSSKSNKTTEEVEEKPKRTRHISVNSNYEEISLRKIDNLVQIILTPSNTKLKNSISIKMFKELHDALTNLAKDDTCRVVLLTSTDSSFCHGVDFSVLIHSSTEKRVSAAQDMAANLKNFLRSLAHFPKPIIAGVQGSAVGLGVTMLPLFDLVFASDKATFSTPYGRLGQVPEGIAFLTLPNLLGNTLTSELMFANRKLTASEAVHHGLVTRTIWPDKFQEDVLSSALSVSSQSGQSMQATKSLLRQSLLAKLDDALESENKLLISHWTSAECQQNFKKLLQEDEWW